jgi:hypothetical protein
VLLRNSKRFKANYSNRQTNPSWGKTGESLGPPLHLAMVIAGVLAAPRSPNRTNRN